MMGALIICFLNLELHLHLLSKALPAPMFLPGVSPPPVRESVAAVTQHNPDFLETTKFIFPLAECPRHDIQSQPDHLQARC